MPGRGSLRAPLYIREMASPKSLQQPQFPQPGVHACSACPIALKEQYLLSTTQLQVYSSFPCMLEHDMTSLQMCDVVCSAYHAWKRQSIKRLTYLSSFKEHRNAWLRGTSQSITQNAVCTLKSQSAKMHGRPLPPGPLGSVATWRPSTMVGSLRATRVQVFFGYFFGFFWVFFLVFWAWMVENASQSQGWASPRGCTGSFLGNFFDFAFIGPEDLAP